jgi:hypothetical protein
MDMGFETWNAKVSLLCRFTENSSKLLSNVYVRSVAFPVTEYNEVISGYRPCKVAER